MKRILFIFLSATLLPGCPKPFQPPKPDYEMWIKDGASILDVKKALLECGSPSPTTTLRTYKHAMNISNYDELMNYVFFVGLCMEKMGFFHKDASVLESCGWYPERKNYPACQPNPKIPEPSVERRLNGWYCKMETDYEYCLKNAPNPKACEPDDQNIPPPECLP